MVYYNYSTSGVGAVLGRLDNIASAGSPTASQKYASYTFLGAGTMVDANYPAVTGIPALTYGSRVNSYSGFDPASPQGLRRASRFGRVVDQKWQNQSAGTVKDQFTYAYDPPSPRLRWAGRANNRLSREVSPDGGNPDANDNYYTYDGLDRLVKSNWGLLNMGKWSEMSRWRNWPACLQSPQDEKELAGIRLATHRGRPLGGDSFMSKMEALLGRRLRPLPVGRPRKKTKETVASPSDADKGKAMAKGKRTRTK